MAENPPPIESILHESGDGAHKDADGYFWILGPVADVLNVAGHRLGTMEIESAPVSHPRVAEGRELGNTTTLEDQAVVEGLRE